MKTLVSDAYMTSLNLWANHVAQSRSFMKGSEKKSYEDWVVHFDNWRKRNVENANQPKSKGDDLQDPFPEQIEWLRKIGFQRSDVIIKYHLWCALVGQKPSVGQQDTPANNGLPGVWCPPTV